MMAAFFFFTLFLSSSETNIALCDCVLGMISSLFPIFCLIYAIVFLLNYLSLIQIQNTQNQLDLLRNLNVMLQNFKSKSSFHPQFHSFSHIIAIYMNKKYQSYIKYLYKLPHAPHKTTKPKYYEKMDKFFYYWIIKSKLIYFIQFFFHYIKAHLYFELYDNLQTDYLIGIIISVILKQYYTVTFCNWLFAAFKSFWIYTKYSRNKKYLEVAKQLSHTVFFQKVADYGIGNLKKCTSQAIYNIRQFQQSRGKYQKSIDKKYELKILEKMHEKIYGKSIFLMSVNPMQNLLQGYSSLIGLISVIFWSLIHSYVSLLDLSIILGFALIEILDTWFLFFMHDTSAYWQEAQVRKRQKLKQIVDNNQICIICFENFQGRNQAILLNCPYKDHAFHVQCLSQWIRVSIRCPICSQIITKNDIEYL